MKRLIGLALAASLWASSVLAVDFTVSDIRIEGLEQVEAGVVFRNFPINRGDLVSQQRLNDATRDLFDSGYFDDVELLRDGDVLVVRVEERPSVALIRIEGNDLVEEDQLRDALRQSGLDEGDIFRRSALDQIRLELLKVYNQAGRYSATIETEAEPLSGNRVALNIDIAEGDTAVIKQINIIGNQAFDDETLIELFDSGLTNMLSFWTDNDKYARERLSADIETLKSWYLDRGYLKFEVNSTQVSISPDQQQVYITIGITEGEQYSYSEIKIAGDLVGIDPEMVRERILITEGELFSRARVTESQKGIQELLGDSGYLFSRVAAIPELVDNTNLVLTFFVEPGKLTYVRRIEIKGNATTSDEVIRRELPQMEGAIARSADIAATKTRLDRLGYFSQVTVENRPVAGADDLVDLIVSVEETMLGEISAGLGFSSAEGVLFQLGIQQDNFLGTGKKFGFNINRSDVVSEYEVNFTDPYYTLDGVSRGYQGYYRERDFKEDDASNYNTNELGAEVSFGYPIDENSRVTLGLGLDQTEVILNDVTSQPEVIRDFLEGKSSDTYLTYNLSIGWSSNYLNSSYFPTEGYSHAINVDLSIPGSDLSYYKAVYNGRYYLPLDSNQTWALGFKTRSGYADSLDSKPYPFFRNFFAGGLRTVRGYRNNSLGPRDVATDDNLGGNILVSGTAELVVPTPFVENKDAWRTTMFIDAGNVFSGECGGSVNCSDSIELSDLRASAGLSISWFTGVGPLSISFAQALNEQTGDETESVQFSLGGIF